MGTAVDILRDLWGILNVDGRIAEPMDIIRRTYEAVLSPESLAMRWDAIHRGLTRLFGLVVLYLEQNQRSKVE